MTLTAAILLILIATIAGSYGWGMRGSVIGGEKGAMLPGALIGISIALFSGIDVIRENWQLFAAAGCLGMGFGGFEPYADTMSFILHHGKPEYNPPKGYIGLCLKGINWFGICGAVLGMSFSAFTGHFYKWYDFVIFMALMQPIQLIGIRIFNKPYDRNTDVRPKIYFSRNSREEWGGNLLLLICLLVLIIVRKDWYSLMFSATGMIFGSLGWSLAIWLYDITVYPLKNGKYIFNTLVKNNIFDGWKLMEFTLGACGGLGFSLYFVLSRKLLTANLAGVTARWNPLGNLDVPVAWISFALVLLIASQAVIVPALEKKFKNIERVLELTERTIYFGITLAVVLLGNIKMAQIIVFCMLLWVITEKNVFERLTEKQLYHPKLFHGFLLSVFALAVVGEILLPNGYPPIACILMYTVYYIFTDMMYTANPKRIKEKKAEHKTCKEFILSFGSPLTFQGFFIIQTIVLVIAFACL